MSSFPVLSRCVTVYRQWPYIRRWIDDPSLFCKGIEWQIINDEPNDPCPDDLLERLASRRITLLQPRVNLGRSGARNLCAWNTNAKWVEFVDGDDIPLPFPLTELSDRNGDRCLHVFPNEIYELANGLPVIQGVEDARDFGFPGLLKRFSSINCRPSCLVYPRDVFIELGGFDGRFDTIEDLHFVWKWDRALWLTTKVVSHPNSKQLYLRDDHSKVIDGIHQPMHKSRFFRMVAEASGDEGKYEASPLWDYADSFLLCVAENTLTELRDRRARIAHEHPAHLSSYLSTVRERAKVLFWLGRDLFLGSAAHDFRSRLIEALKICFKAQPGS